MALVLSSDEEAEIEQISPIIGKRQIDIDEEIAFRPKRCKVKLKRPQNGTSKSRSDLDVSKLVKKVVSFKRETATIDAQTDWVARQSRWRLRES